MEKNGGGVGENTHELEKNAKMLEKINTIIWFPDAKWAPVPGGLADHPDFLRYMSLVENTAGPWFKLSVFGELGLNNAGRRAARENRKVFLKPFIHFLARPSD